jgi:predicted nucleotidyltransferase
MLHTIPTESRAIAGLVKSKISSTDETASVILFGSRARGDAADDSDWDFLILTQQDDADFFADKFRKIILREVELKHNVAISLMVKNKRLWDTDYPVTNIFKSINEEGILL